MNINKKIIELGIALWEQRAAEVAQSAKDCTDMNKLNESFSAALKIETGETMETIDFIKNGLSPKQKGILLFWLTIILTMLAASEDGEATAPTIAGAIIKAAHEFIKEDTENLGKLSLAELVALSISVPTVKEKRE